MKTRSNSAPVEILESLEARIAPASAIYTDVDGDKITVTTTKGTDTELQTIVDNGENMGQMETLDLTSTFAGSSVKFYVNERVAGGDGMVNVWHIKASGIDLGSVEVAGDLAKLTVGDPNYANGSVKSVKVQSIGVNGGAADKVWSMLGGTGTFAVAGDVSGAKLEWSNPNTNEKLTVNSVTIGGNLTGGTADDTGSVILTSGTGGTAELKSISIGGNLAASDYNKSGAIIVGNPAATGDYIGIIGKATIGGSMTGDNNHTYSGAIFASKTIGPVQVGGTLTGGGEGSGSIFAADKITGDVNIGGSVYGGAGIYSGSVFAFNGITKSVTIGGMLAGSGGAYGGAVASQLGPVGNVSIGTYLSGGSGIYSGSVYGKTGLGNVSVGGSVFGGSNDNTGFIGTDTSNGTNYKAGDITVGGDLNGGSDFSSGLIAVGTAGNISVGGSINGGNTVTGTGGIYALETVKSVFVGGDLDGGTQSNSGSIRVLGTAAKISSIHIAGSILGDDGASSGSVKTLGSVDKFIIGGGIGGGNGTDSGNVTFGTIKSLSVGTGASIIGSIYGGSASGAGVVTGNTLGTAVFAGNVIGGGASNAGKIIATTAKDISIAGTLQGGAADDTGAVVIGAGGITGKLTIGTDLTGTANYSNSGLVSVAGAAKAIEIKGSIVGGNASANNKSNSGAVLVTGALKSITVGGDIKAGTYFSTSDINLGAVRAGSIDTMLVKGSLVGANTNSRVLISGQGDTAKTSGTNLAIKSLTVLGSVSNAMILGGYDTTGTTINGNGGNNGGGAQIGTVTVNGDFFNGSVATGVSNDAATFGEWADGTNVLLNANSIVASIAKIVIKGNCFAGTQSGIAAEKIQSLTVGGFAVPIGTGAQFINPISGNFKAQQVVA